MSDFRYGGRAIDFWFPVQKGSGEPIHEISGFSLISRINGRHRTQATSKAYVQHLKMFWEDVVLWNDLDWRDITDEQIVLYLYQHRFLQDKCSGKTIGAQLIAISEFYKWAYHYGLIEYPKEIDIGFDYPDLMDQLIYSNKQTLIQSQYISKDDFNLLLASITGETRYVLIRDELALLLGYDVGLRTSELTNGYNLNVRNLKDLIKKTEFDNRTTFDIVIHGKGNNKARVITVTTRLFLKFKIFLSDKKLRGKFSEDLPLFLDPNGKPIISPDYGSSVFRRAKNNCPQFYGDSWKHKHYHSLRHTYATNLAAWCYENNKSWQAVLPPKLGHKDWRTSLIYVELDALLNNRVELLEKLKSKGNLRRYSHGR